jgi:hypothetical protein
MKKYKVNNFIQQVKYEDVDTDSYFDYILDYPNSLVGSLHFITLGLMAAEGVYHKDYNGYLDYTYYKYNKKAQRILEIYKDKDYYGITNTER